MQSRKRLTILITCLAVLGIGVAMFYTFGPRVPKTDYGQRSDARVLERVAGDRADQSVTVISDTYTLDKLYLSMHGPNSFHRGFTLSEPVSADDEELLWVTGVQLDVVDAESLADVSPEFFCHANVTLNKQIDIAARNRERFAGTTHMGNRLFTLVPGRQTITLPAGFGIPVYSGEALDNFTMSLNQNVPDRTVKIRMKTRIDYTPDRLKARPMKALFRRAIYGMEKIDETNKALFDLHLSGDACKSCAPEFAIEASGKVSQMEFDGVKYTIHWWVQPGRHTFRRDVTDQLKLPFDTTAHLVTGHLHPYGESITLRDVTAGKDMFVIKSEDYKDKLGVARMDTLTFEQGVELKRDHKYELITVYNNTRGKPTDAMSIVYLYLLEQDFHPDKLASK